MNDKQLPPRETVVWTGILSDTLLAVAKGSIGYLSGSKALMGDAIYSGADAAAKLAGVIPWNRKQSHKAAGSAVRSRSAQGSKEPMAAILFSVLILMGGLQVAFSAIRDLTRGHLSAPGQSALAAVLLCIVFKEAVFQYQYRYHKKKGDGSHAAYADSHRFSLYTSITVFIGIALAMTGGYLNWHPLLYMDPIAALLAGCLILRKGYSLITSSVYKRIQELPSEEAASFIETVQRVHGVIRVEQLSALEEGSYVNLHVKISVNPRISVMEAQDISECARKLLQHRFVHVGEVHMDVVPYDPGYPYKSNHELVDNDIPTLLQ
ncbi:cation diffusion facilitator family transporter [Paenibacillus tritici]|jgi:cation diffusion facilitator family transporter|uniref:Cation diffusion facilitator family transporter n=1 Tax=Paenibacillus tritici TaxID=1873425 RepID=A0ABX2DJ97_9BACL|nr:cation diffusion facilitator family transporter [Paenibacillus tritici]NQX44685.1 cation diffusion facilitator family transporter [Paenibacillus tritici]QUL53730.1 cation diffusion facilitator family transporter [Paenibacillus tritici]